MLSLAILALISSASAAPAACPPFERWLAAHPRAYAGAAAAAAARAAYADNAAAVSRHNARYAAGAAGSAALGPNASAAGYWSQPTHFLGCGEFADEAAEAFAARLAGMRPARLRARLGARGGGGGGGGGGALPQSVDWQARGFVAPVQSSGQCGSLALAVVDAAGSDDAVRRNAPPTPFDPAQVANCDGCGCGGCLVSQATGWVAQHGLARNYSARDKCAYAADVTARSVDVRAAGNETALLAALAGRPVLAAINLAALQLYAGGIVTKDCGDAVDSVILATGYGAEGAAQFYRLKNYWGASWGEKGYVRVGRGPAFPPNGVCGVQSAASFFVTAGE